jgi:tRNA-splicing ligase RtcB (3'-phosphate/5'-hydroxy nucleic acid ligase)
VRLIRTSLVLEDIRPRIRELVTAIYRKIPTGVGSEGAIADLPLGELDRLLLSGAEWSVQRGFGSSQDLQFIEESGRLEGADPALVSQRAKERGRSQVGTLGSGNHFLEIDFVEEIFDSEAAEAMGLAEKSVCLMIHSGSRGLGYQVCHDHLTVMDVAMRKYGFNLPDRQLACAPIESPEGQQYIGAMYAAANYAWANRQVMTHLMEEAFLETLSISPRSLGYRLVYDVCHNIAKMETHVMAGKSRRLLVHRKGATRAFPAGHPQVPAAYRRVGQPVLIPGDMGTASYVLLGTEQAMAQTFGSSCHGAGRRKSRKQAMKEAGKRDLFEEMEKQGVVVMSTGRRTIAEEMPEAYKNIDEVVDVAHQAGISRKVARLRPIGCVKG